MAFYKCEPSGGTSQTAEGSLTASAGVDIVISIGFTPTRLAIVVHNDNVTTGVMDVYDSRISTTKYYCATKSSTGSTSFNAYDVTRSGATNGAIKSITNGVVTLGAISSTNISNIGKNVKWFAISD